MAESTTPGAGADGWWLLRDGDVLCAAEVASSLAERSKGLLGRKGYDGALVLHHTRAVRRGVKQALLVADMPYGSYHVGADDAVRNAVLGELRRRGVQAVTTNVVYSHATRPT